MKEKMLQLVGALSKASVHHYQIVNGDKRGVASRAASEELKAARALLTACGVEATSSEISAALGW